MTRAPPEQLQLDLTPDEDDDTDFASWFNALPKTPDRHDTHTKDDTGPQAR